MAGILPDRLFIRVLKVGVDSLVADPDPIDDILGSMTAAERTKVKDFFVSNKPTIIQGYPRGAVTFPLFAITSMTDAEESKYIGEAEHALLDDDDFKTGDIRVVRRKETIGIYVVGHNSEIVASLYD